MSQEIAVQNNAESGSYEAILDGKVVGLVVYERRDGRMIFRHTIVDPGYRGRGIATELVRGALDDLVAQGLTLTNYCGFIDSFITANPAYARVVDQRQPGRVTPFEARHERSGSARSSDELPGAAVTTAGPRTSLNFGAGNSG